MIKRSVAHFTLMRFSDTLLDTLERRRLDADLIGIPTDFIIVTFGSVYCDVCDCMNFENREPSNCASYLRTYEGRAHREIDAAFGCYISRTKHAE